MMVLNSVFGDRLDRFACEHNLQPYLFIQEPENGGVKETYIPILIPLPNAFNEGGLPEGARNYVLLNESGKEVVSFDLEKGIPSFVSAEYLESALDEGLIKRSTSEKKENNETL